MEPVKRTCLYNVHHRLGARMTEFGGFEMPLSYDGIIGEHLAVRNAAGVFDLSHMGEFELRGPQSLALLENAFTNSAARLVDGQAQYTMMCAADGGTIDDLIVYRLAPDHYMLCVNASNIAVDRERLAELNRFGAVFRDISDETALIAIQGPMAQTLLASLVTLDVASLKRFRCVRAEVAGIDSLIARTGYTGEDGFEIFVESSNAQSLFEKLLDAGASSGAKPCGLGARDTLRMEAGLPLYGHELDRSTSPLEAGLSHFVRLGRDFVGEPALSAQKREGLRKHLVGIRTDDGKSIARQGYKLYAGAVECGVVTSGTYAPTFQRPLAMAYLLNSVVKESDAPDNLQLEVEIRNRRVAASVVPLPFYNRENAKNPAAPNHPA